MDVDFMRINFACASDVGGSWGQRAPRGEVIRIGDYFSSLRDPPGGGFWILKIAHAPSDKNLSKFGFCPRKGVAFLRKTFSQKNFQMRERIPPSALVPAHRRRRYRERQRERPVLPASRRVTSPPPVDSEKFRPTLRTCRPGGASLMVRRTDYEGEPSCQAYDGANSLPFLAAARQRLGRLRRAQRRGKSSRP